MSNYFCPSCGSFINAYAKEVMDIINRALEGEVITIVSDDASHKHMRHHPSVYSLYDRELGSNAKFLQDALFDQVLEFTFEYDPYETETFQSREKITNDIRINPVFSKHRSDFTRSELKIASPYDNTCPVCGGDTIQYMFKLGSDFYDAERRECEKSAEQYINEVQANCLVTEEILKKENLDIKGYLDKLISIESEIYYFEKQLKALCIAQKDTGRKALKERCLGLKLAEESVKHELQAVIAEKKKLNEKYQLRTLNISPDDFGLFLPEPPVIMKAGLFNKKQIEAENMRAKELYESEMATFNSKWEHIQAEEQEKITRENNDITKLREAEEVKLDAQISNLSEQIETGSIDVSSSGIQQADEFCLKEIDEVKEKIVQLCNIRAQLIALNVIYPKYLNLIALTTFSEYFETGRCTTLEGPDGAYNLFENEIRANRIIAQLDQVIDSLDTIKQNQYKAYCVLSQISNDTTSISDKMTSAVKSLSEISTNTAVIKETNAQIAYNTAKTAHYAKVNAELTNALGYIAAFK